MPPAAVRVLSSYSEAGRSRSQPSDRPFVDVEICGNIGDALGAWAEIEARSTASPYQSAAFCRGWFDTVGITLGVSPLIVIARGADGAVTALLPLGRRKYGPLQVASFLGDRCANFHMGLFSSAVTWADKDVEALLRQAGRRSRPRIDAFLFMSQPLEWRGVPNPMALLAHQASPSFAYSSRLPGDYDTWLNAHFSKASQKKLRKKSKKLEAIGAVEHFRPVGQAQTREILNAFFAQKRARMAALKQSNEFEDRPNIEMLERYVGLGGDFASPPTMELHALRAGSRIVATFGGFSDAYRLSGMVISYEIDPAVAASSPGELLVMEIVRDAIHRGLSAFDLGVGESRYKSESCELTEPLFDSGFGVTFAGRLAASAYLAIRGAKRRIKQSERLFALAKAVRARLR